MNKPTAQRIFAIFMAGLVMFAVNANATTAPFTTNLSFQMTGSASVKTLQQFLTNQGLYSGPISGNYLMLTMQGVREFQIMNNITPSSGYFGPMTRAKANAIASGENTSSTTVMVTPTPTGTVAGASTTNLLAFIQVQLNNMFATVRNLQQRFFGHKNNTSPTTVTTNQTSAPSPTTTITTTTPTPSGTSPAPIVATNTLQVNTGTKKQFAHAQSSTTPTPTSSQSPTSTTTSPAPTIPTTTAQATVPNTLLWGAYVGDIDSNPSLVSSFASLTGRSPNIIATFTDLSSGDFPSGEQATVGAQGKTLLLFLEPQYSFDQLNSGAYDSILQQYATAAAAYGDPIIIAPFDEFNLNENAWGYSIGGNTPAKFIQAWQHIHGFFANDPNVKFALVYNNVPEPADSVNTYAAYYPGNAYVDYVAVDGFNFGASTASAQSFEQIFNPIMPTLESFNKPILFTSVGSLEYPGKAQWISHGLGTYIEQYPNVAGWVYFNYDDTSAGQNWRIDTDAASVAAFQAVIP